MAKTGVRGKVSASLAGRDALVEAVVLLQPNADGSTPLPEESRSAASSVLAAVTQATGIEPDASTVFDSLHSFSVRAPKAFVEALSGATGVAQVLPNQLPRSALIEPVKKRAVKLPG